MADAVSIPILVDGDTGHGIFNNVRRFIHKLLERGIVCVCIEDKLFSKTNSFIGENQPLAGIHEFCSRIKAGKDGGHQPQLKSFSIEVLPDAAQEFRHGLHQYVYNFEDHAARLRWNGGRSAILGLGDSAYFHPMVPHAFDKIDSNGATNLLVVHIPGSLTVTLTEFAGFGLSRRRAIHETNRWY
jgi:Phosphoenolpyruvate phosphomutase